MKSRRFRTAVRDGGQAGGTTTRTRAAPPSGRATRPRGADAPGDVTSNRAVAALLRVARIGSLDAPEEREANALARAVSTDAGSGERQDGGRRRAAGGGAAARGGADLGRQGQPLPGRLRRTFESRFQADLGR